MYVCVCVCVLLKSDCFTTNKMHAYCRKVESTQAQTETKTVTPPVKPRPEGHPLLLYLRPTWVDSSISREPSV